MALKEADSRRRRRPPAAAITSCCAALSEPGTLLPWLTCADIGAQAIALVLDGPAVYNVPACTTAMDGHHYHAVPFASTQADQGR